MASTIGICLAACWTDGLGHLFDSLHNISFRAKEDLGEQDSTDGQLKTVGGQVSIMGHQGRTPYIFGAEACIGDSQKAIARVGGPRTPPRHALGARRRRR